MPYALGSSMRYVLPLLAVGGARISLAAFSASAAVAAVGPGPLYTLTAIAGTDPRNVTGDGNSAIYAAVSPETLALDQAGNLYIGERGTARVRKIAPSGIISTVAGPDASSGTTQLGASLGVAVDASGVPHIADTDHNRVLKLTASGAITTVAGTGTFDSAGDGGPATAASMRQPFGLAFDAKGNLYIGEYGG